MSVFGVAASAAAKWVLAGEEPFRDEALLLLKEWLDSKIRLLVPDFFWVELTNVLWKAVRRGRCTKETALAALAALLDYPIPTIPSLNLLNSPLQKGLLYKRTVYHSIYLLLALKPKPH